MRVNTSINGEVVDQQRVEGDRGRPRRAQRGSREQKVVFHLSHFSTFARPAPPLHQSASAAAARLIDRSLTAVFTISSGTFKLPLYPPLPRIVRPFSLPTTATAKELLDIPAYLPTRLLSVSPRVYSIFVLHCCRVASISCYPQESLGRSRQPPPGSVRILYCAWQTQNTYRIHSQSIYTGHIG